MGATISRLDRDDIETMSFEDSYSRLEQVIRQLEEGDLTLEESVALYEEGMFLARHCGKHLQRAEVKVTELLNAAEPEDDDLSGPIEDLP